MKHGKRVSATLDPSLREDHADKVHTGTLQQRKTRSIGKVSDISRGDVPDNVQAMVHDSNRGKAFVAHQEQGIRQGCVGAIVMSV